MSQQDVWTESAKAAVARFDPTPKRRRQWVANVAAAASRGLIKRLNHLEVFHADRLTEARTRQGPGHGLLTVANHAALFDDPWLTACIGGHDWPSMRWVAVDAENFFGSDLKARFFNTGKAVPIVRGAGLDQPGMDFLIDRLKLGDWVHVFPEGTRSREPDSRLRRPLKTGMAHMVQRARPLLLAFHHRGMHEVLPIGARIPRVGKTVTVRFGRVHDSDQGLADQDTEAIMAWAESELLALEAETFGD